MFSGAVQKIAKENKYYERLESVPLRLLQAATKTLQLDQVRFFGYF